MRLLRIVAFAVFSLLSATQVRAQPDPSFAPFWSSFRQAVSANDTRALASFTRFPLAVHGQTDSEPVRRVDDARFRAAIAGWLEQDTGMSRQPEPMRALILRTDPAAAARSRGASDRAVRVGSFFFERGPAGWRLTRIYEER
jgi:hypothetical protein